MLAKQYPDTHPSGNHDDIQSNVALAGTPCNTGRQPLVQNAQSNTPTSISGRQPSTYLKKIRNRLDLLSIPESGGGNIESLVLKLLCTESNINRIAYGDTYSKSMDQPGKVANPDRGQLNREAMEAIVASKGITDPSKVTAVVMLADAYRKVRNL